MYLGYQNNKIKLYTEQPLDKVLYNLDKVEETQDEYVLDGDEYVLNDEKYKEEQEQARREQFNKDFFQTSLGYIRRKVSMATGETKDFLSDLLPTISMGVQMGQPVIIIAYAEPDFTTDIIDWEALQTQVQVNAQFVQECFMQLSNDFKPVTPDTDTDLDTETDTETDTDIDTEIDTDEETEDVV